MGFFGWQLQIINLFFSYVCLSAADSLNLIQFVFHCTTGEMGCFKSYFLPDN